MRRGTVAMGLGLVVLWTAVNNWELLLWTVSSLG